MFRSEHIFDPKNPVVSAVRAGLREALPACREPIPARMEKILAHLREVDQAAGPTNEDTESLD